jgi:hypothetical protein
MIPPPLFSAVSFDILFHKFDINFYDETAEFLSEIIPPKVRLKEVVG